MEEQARSTRTRGTGREGGRRARKAQGAAEGVIKQAPFKQPVNNIKPIEILSEDQIEAIHQTSLTILKEIGLEVWSEHALDLYEKGGADVDRDKQLVRFDPACVEQLISTTPATFKLTPRNPERALIYGGKHVLSTMVGGPPNVNDCVRGRRGGSIAAYEELIKLGQFFNSIHAISNQPIAPTDLPVVDRHLDCYRINTVNSDKVWAIQGIGRERVIDGVTLAALSRGLTLEDLVTDPATLTIVSVNSPRRLDGSMCDGLIAMAELAQPVVVTPFTLMGAMTPVTIAGGLAQQNAEALAGLALVQLVRPGNPAIYGGFTSNVDMKSGAPAFGTPEYAKAAIATGQLCRRYGIPYRASNVNASNCVDAQSIWESQTSIWACVMGGVHMLHHGAGWLEGGLSASYEKLVVDAEMLQAFWSFLEPVVINEDELALSAQREVKCGGHFFGAQHTMERYDHAFYQPFLSDWRNFENWEEAGALNATQRATKIWQAVLETFEPPAIDPAHLEAVDAYIAKRKDEIARGINRPE